MMRQFLWMNNYANDPFEFYADYNSWEDVIGWRFLWMKSLRWLIIASIVMTTMIDDDANNIYS